MGGQVVYLWDSEVHGLPATAEQAADVLQDIRQSKPAAPSNNLKLFSQALQDYALSSDEDDVVEGFGTFAQTFNAQARFIAMDVGIEGGNDLLRFLIKAAPIHHLIVLNAEPLTVFLPDGEVLPPEMKSVWANMYEEFEEEAEDAFPRTKGAFKKELDRRLLETLSKHRVFNKGSTPKAGIWGGDPCLLSDLFEGCKLYVSSGVYGGDGEFTVSFSILVSFDGLSDVMRSYKFYRPELVFDVSLYNGLLKEKRKSSRISTCEMLVECIFEVESVLFPSFEKVTDLAGLDKVINRDDSVFSKCLHDYIYMPQCLVLARLANNENFDELCDVLYSSKGWFVNYNIKETEWPRLVKYLREEVKPLV